MDGTTVDGDGTPPANRIQDRWRYAWPWSAIWLVYLVAPLRYAWGVDDPMRRALGVATVAVFAVAFVTPFASIRIIRQRNNPISPVLRWGVLLVMLALTIVATPVIGEPALGMLSYVLVTSFFALPSRPAVLFAGSLILTAAVLPNMVPGWQPNYDLVFTLFVTSVAIWGIVQIIERNAQLAAAQQEIARLAVADERNRFARDLHDILGHALTVITVKAELAGRLVRLAPERAEIEIADLEGISRQALRDVRAAVTGYREVSLAGELASARTALSAAGIEADLPDTVDQVPADHQEVFGWVVREGVTNVVRHGGAKRCRIRITPAEVEITDDGRGPAGRAGSDRGTPGGSVSLASGHGGGHGLAGLRERAGAIGGSLTVGRTPEGGFALRVRVP